MNTTVNKPSKAYGIQQMDILTMKDVSDGAKLLHTYYSVKTGGNKDCWPKNATIAEDLGWGLSKVKKYKKELLDLGLIESKNVGADGAIFYAKVTPKYIVVEDKPETTNTTKKEPVVAKVTTEASPDVVELHNHIIELNDFMGVDVAAWRLNSVEILQLSTAIKVHTLTGAKAYCESFIGRAKGTSYPTSYIFSDLKGYESVGKAEITLL